MSDTFKILFKIHILKFYFKMSKIKKTGQKLKTK